MKMLLEFLIFELGISLQPLRQSYTKYEKWVTHNWLKTLWEKLDMFNVILNFHIVLLVMAWE
jgi:hypothetical protein